MENFGAAISGGNAYVRDGFADADGASKSNGRGATDADDAVSLRHPLDGVVDDVGFYIDEGGIEKVRVEVGDEGLDMASSGHARGADDDERRRQVQTGELVGQADNGTRAVDDAGARCGGGG